VSKKSKNPPGLPQTRILGPTAEDQGGATANGREKREGVKQKRWLHPLKKLIVGVFVPRGQARLEFSKKDVGRVGPKLGQERGGLNGK